MVLSLDLGFCAFFAIVILRAWIEKQKMLDSLVSIVCTGGVSILSAWIGFLLVTSGQLLSARAAVGGPRLIDLLFFCVAYFLFMFYPKINAIRALTLTVYLVAITEIEIVSFQFGIAQILLQYVLFSIGTLFVFAFTIIVSIREYWPLIKLPTICTLVVIVTYTLFWISVGFPFTLSPFQGTGFTQWYANPLVNMIESSSHLIGVAVFTSTYLAKARA